MMIRVKILDAESIAREGTKGFLSSYSDIDILAEGCDFASLTKGEKPDNGDVIIMEIIEADHCLVDKIVKLRGLCPGIKILVLSHCSERDYAIRAIRSGALGFVEKTCSPHELANAVRKVAQGRPYVSENLCEILVSRVIQGATDNTTYELSDADTKFLRLLMNGNTVTEISNIIGITARQVRSKKLELMKKTDSKSTADLYRYARDHKLTI